MSPVNASLDLRSIASALGGRVEANDRVRAPGPDHSRHDDSLIVWLDPAAPEGFRVTSHSGDDWREARDYVREKAGLPAWEPTRHEPSPIERMTARAATIGQQWTEYVYRDEHGERYLRVQRTLAKKFYQSHWTGTAWANGKPKGPKLPYRLPELLAEVRDTRFICEGEKDADNLAALGLAATTASEGAGKWTPDLNPWFKDYDVHILAHNDQAGADHANKVARNLLPIARTVRIINLPGLPPKGDVSDWINAGGTASELVDFCKAQPLYAGDPPAAPAVLRTIDPASWSGVPIPLRQWLLYENIPVCQTTYLTGAGSSGKSLFGQQLATAVALGRRLFGMETRQATALYITCEDDAEELHRRQDAICEAFDVDFDQLSGRLHLASLMGEIGNELCTFDQAGTMTLTPAWERLRATVLQLGAGFIVLDNVAHLFAGNENIRNQVAAFCGLLNRLAAEAGAAVLFIGHPNKAGADFSGSTAWENQVRSRLFLDRPKDEEGNILDPDVRVLSRQKSNYAQLGERVEFRWYRGAFYRDCELPGATGASVAERSAERADDQTFLACLDKATAERRSSSPNKSANNYAPRLFSIMPTAKRTPVRRLEAAMQRLLDAGEIAGEQPLFQRENRAWVNGLGRARRVAPTPHEPAHDAAPTDAEEH